MYIYISYSRNVLGMDDSSGLENLGSVKWQLAVLLFLAWLIIFLVLIKGIDSLGKVSSAHNIAFLFDSKN